MDNLSAQQKLMGNMQATSAELLSGIMEERGRGFASDREAWAQLKENIENVESRMKAIKDVHKDMWSAVKDHNGDAFCALAGEFQRSAILLAIQAGTGTEEQAEQGQEADGYGDWQTVCGDHQNAGRDGTDCRTNRNRSGTDERRGAADGGRDRRNGTADS